MASSCTMVPRSRLTRLITLFNLSLALLHVHRCLGMVHTLCSILRDFVEHGFALPVLTKMGWGVALSASVAWPKLGRSLTETFFTSCANMLAYDGLQVPEKSFLRTGLRTTVLMQGCQMVYFHTQNPNMSISEWKMLVYIFYRHYGHLVKSMAIW
jgi:hypothetical protein